MGEQERDDFEVYKQIWYNAHNGNWTDATKIAYNLGWDAYKLINIYERLEDEDLHELYLSMKDIAVLGCYIERMRCENRIN